MAPRRSRSKKSTVDTQLTPPDVTTPVLPVVDAPPRKRKRLPKVTTMDVQDVNSSVPPSAVVLTKPLAEKIDHPKSPLVKRPRAIPRILEVLDSDESSPTDLPVAADKSVTAAFVDQSELAELAILRRRAFAAYADVSEPEGIDIQNLPDPTNFAALLKHRLEQPEPQVVEILAGTENYLEGPLDHPASGGGTHPADVETNDDSGIEQIQQGLSGEPEGADTREPLEPTNFAAPLKNHLEQPEPQAIEILAANDNDLEAPQDPPASQDVTYPADIETKADSGIEQVQASLSEEPEGAEIQELSEPISFAALLKQRLEQPEPQAIKILAGTDNDLEAPPNRTASEDVARPADIETKADFGIEQIQENLSGEPEVTDTQESSEPASFAALLKSRLEQSEPQAIEIPTGANNDVEAPRDLPASEDLIYPAEVETIADSGTDLSRESLSEDGIDTLLLEPSREVDSQILPSLDFLNSPFFFSSVSLAPRATHGISKYLATTSRTNPGKKLELRGTLPEQVNGHS